METNESNQTPAVKDNTNQCAPFSQLSFEDLIRQAVSETPKLTTTIDEIAKKDQSNDNKPVNLETFDDIFSYPVPARAHIPAYLPPSPATKIAKNIKEKISISKNCKKQSTTQCNNNAISQRKDFFDDSHSGYDADESLIQIDSPNRDPLIELREQKTKTKENKFEPELSIIENNLNNDFEFRFTRQQLLEMKFVQFIEEEDEEEDRTTRSRENDFCAICRTREIDHFHYYLRSRKAISVPAIPQLIGPKKFSSQICANCEQVAADFPRRLCPACGVTYFCSRRCQIDGWQSHHSICDRINRCEKANSNICGETHAQNKPDRDFNLASLSPQSQRHFADFLQTENAIIRREEANCEKHQYGKSSVISEKSLAKNCDEKLIDLDEDDDDYDDDRLFRSTSSAACSRFDKNDNLRTHSRYTIEDEESSSSKDTGTVSKSNSAKKLTKNKNFSPLKLSLHRTYHLLPLHIEKIDHLNREQIVFYLCKRDYLAKVVTKIVTTIEASRSLAITELKVGHFYIVKFDSHWFRAELQRVTNDSRALVRFIDFGNREYLPSRKVAEKFREGIFRTLDDSLHPNRMAAAAIRCIYGIRHSDSNSSSSERVSAIRRILTECVDNFAQISLFVSAFVPQIDTYIVQLNENNNH